MKSDKQIFSEAADLIENVGWCQGAAAADKEGMDIDGIDRKDFENAAYFCVQGAIWYVGDGGAFELSRTSCYKTLKQYIHDNYGDGEPYIWNDNYLTTKEDVVRVLRTLATHETDT